MKKIAFIITMLMMFSCNALNISQDGISKEVVDVSEIIDASNAFKQRGIEIENYLHDVKIIPLETTEASILSNIRQLLVTKKFIYVKDDYQNGGVAIFNIEGKFIKRLPNGGAPHEIGRAGSMSVNPKNGHLFVIDNAVYKIIEYSPDGEYINNYYAGKITGDIAVENDKFLFVQRGIQNKSGYFVFSISDNKFTSSTDIYLGSEPFAFIKPKYIDVCDNGYNVMLPWVNTVFYYQKGKMYKKYYIKNINADNLDYSAYQRAFEMTNTLSKGMWLYNGTMMETREMDIMMFQGAQNDLMQVLRNKKTKECYTIQATNSIYHYANCRNVYSYKDNAFCGILLSEDIKNEEDPDWAWDGSNPLNLISSEDMAKLKAVNPDDNPLVITYRIDLDRPNKK